MSSQAQPLQTQAAPAPASQPDDSQNPQSQQAVPDDKSTVTLSDDAADGAPVRVHRAFSKMQEALAAALDELGVPRTFSLPYVDGQQHSDHLAAVAQAAAKAGGVTNNLLASFHHAAGKGWGSGDGVTVAYPASKLHSTIIPKGSEPVKEAIAATRSVLNGVASLIGDDHPAVKTAKSQLNLVGGSDASGMSAFDFAVSLQQIVFGPVQALVKAYSGTHPGGHSPQLRAPHSGATAAAAPQQ